MTKDDRGVSDLMDKELLNIANLAGSYYKAKKIRDLLSNEIRKCCQEMVHLRDKGDVLAKQLRETRELIEEIELRVAESQRLLGEAHTDLLAAEDENAKIERYVLDLGSKREMLPGLKSQVMLLNKEVQEESSRLNIVQSRHAEACGQREEIEREVAGFDSRLSKLEQEIAVMQSTRDLLKGKMPEHLDPEVFKDLQGRSLINFDAYVSEVQFRVSTVEKEISSLKMQLAEDAGQKETLSALEKELMGAVEEISDHAAIYEDRNSILIEIDTMEDDLVRLGRATDGAKLESQELESGISALEEAFMREKQHERELLDRLKHLDVRILELGDVDNMSDKLDELRTEAARLDINLDMNSKYLDAMTKAKEDAEAMNVSLKAAVAEHREVVDRFERTISNIEDDTQR
jgi:chromosome segregation ATPase